MSYQKYHNKPTFIDGIRFASKAEAQFYTDLKLRERAGQVRDIELQPKFELQPKYTNAKGQKIPAIYYIADYRYYDIEAKCTFIVDVKGVETDVFKLKKKLFEYKYPDQTIVLVNQWR